MHVLVDANVTLLARKPNSIASISFEFCETVDYKMFQNGENNVRFAIKFYDNGTIMSVYWLYRFAMIS